MSRLTSLWASFGLQTRFLTVTGLVLLGIGLFQPLLQVHRLSQQYRQDMREKLEESLNGLQLALRVPVQTHDTLAIRQIMQHWGRQQDVTFVEWRAHDFPPIRIEKLALARVPGWFQAYAGLQTIEQARPLASANARLGTLQLGIGSHYWTDRLWQRFVSRLLESAVMIAVIFTAITLVLRRGIGSLSSLVQAARRYRAGHYGARGLLTPGMAPEIREIVLSVNQAAEYLAQIMHAVQGASEAISIYDVNGKMLFANRAFTEMFGFSLAQIQTTQTTDAPAAVPHLQAIIPLARIGHAWSGQQTSEISGKGPRTLFVKTEPVTDEHETTVGLMAIMSDITEQQRSQRLSERLGRLLDDSLNEIYVIDAQDWHFVQVNRGACGNLGYTMDELHALSLLEIQPRLTRPALEALLAPLHERSSHRVHFTTVHRRKNGEEYPVDVYLQYADSESPPVYYAIAEDISAHELAERRLRESEMKYRALVESGGDWVWEIDTENRYTYTSPQVQAILGYPADAILGMQPFDFMSEAEGARVLTQFMRFAKERSPILQMEHINLHRDGRRVVLETNAIPILDKHGVFRGYRGTDRDITARKRAEEALQEITTQYRGIVSHIPGMVFQLLLEPNGDLRFPFVGGGAKVVAGLDAAALQADTQHLLERLNGGDYDAFFASLYHSRDHMSDWQWEGRIEEAGKVRWINLRGSPHARHDCSIVWDGVILEITSSKRAELEIKESRDQLRELSSYLQAAREEEKANIARDIHDELGGTLTALKMGAYWLEHKLAEEAPDLQAKAVEMTGLLDEAIRSVRRIATELRPTVLDDLGLPAALEWLAREFQKRTNTHCEVAMPSIEPPLNQAMALALFRIAQESLTNVARHAHASEVKLSFGVADDAYVLEIRDNGIGIAANRIAEPTSRGIRGMVERVHLLGGDIQIEGYAGQGSVVRATIPFPEHR